MRNERGETESFLQAWNTDEIVHGKQVWPHPKHFPSVQTFLPSIVRFMWQYHMDMTFSSTAKKLRCNLWSEELLSPLNSLDDKTSLDHYFRSYGVTVRPFLIRQPVSQMSCFASQDFSKSEAPGYYYGSRSVKIWTAFLTWRSMVRVRWQCQAEYFLILQFVLARNGTALTYKSKHSRLF